MDHLFCLQEGSTKGEDHREREGHRPKTRVAFIPSARMHASRLGGCLAGWLAPLLRRWISWTLCNVSTVCERKCAALASLEAREEEVKIPCVPEKALMVGVFVTPRPGVPLRKAWGWKPLLHTPSSWVWVLPGALQSLGFLELLDAAASWVGRSTYRTAWAVSPWSGCQRSYSYGHGPAVGPHTVRGFFRYLVSAWRALAPFVALVCGWGCAISCELEPLRRLEIACQLASR